jgi:hypothetical protein
MPENTASFAGMLIHGGVGSFYTNVLTGPQENKKSFASTT